MKGNKNNFCKYINSKSMANVAPTLSGAVDPMIKTTEKAELLVAFFALVFTGTVCSLALSSCLVAEFGKVKYYLW